MLPAGLARHSLTVVSTPRKSVGYRFWQIAIPLFGRDNCIRVVVETTVEVVRFRVEVVRFRGDNCRGGPVPGSAPVDFGGEIQKCQN